MDIDVKNAYKKAVAACGDEGYVSLLHDIRNFIYYISKDNAEDRFEEFCKIYADKKIPKGSFSETLDMCEAFSVRNARGRVSDIVAFFTVLGKYYVFSKFDKHSIDKERYIAWIKGLNSKIPQKENKNNSISSNSRTISEQDDCIDQVHEETKDQSNQSEEGESEEKEPEETLEELLEKLHSLIGLDGVKEEVDQMINLVRLQKRGEELGEKPVPLSLHLVFYGNPGTGKTTVARLLAKIYKALGVLSKGQLIEVDRGGLVGGYVGQTAIKTQEVIDKAMGGILFIDEAYALTHGKGDGDFGQEAVDTVLKAMEDHRDDFIVIVAGYPDLMKEFISSNPGLKSRFNQYINFEDYNPAELKKIFDLQCRNQNLLLEPDCDKLLNKHFTDMYENRSNDYANGRDVRNYFEKVVKTRANRLNPILDKITKEEYRTILVSDLEEAERMKNNTWK